MQSKLVTTIPRNRLLNILHSNREKHVKDYNAAMKIFKEDYLEKIDEIRDKADKEEIFPTHINVDKPVSYMTEYDRVIKMLELSDEERIKLDEATFDMFVNDNWDWKGHFLSNTVKYLTK